MEEELEIETYNREFNKLEEIFEDRGGVCFHTIISFGPVHELKIRLKTLEEQGIDLYGVQRSHFQYFCPDQNLNFLDFVAWCASNYS